MLNFKDDIPTHLLDLFQEVLLLSEARLSGIQIQDALFA